MNTCFIFIKRVESTPKMSNIVFKKNKKRADFVHNYSVCIVVYIIVIFTSDS